MSGDAHKLLALILAGAAGMTVLVLMVPKLLGAAAGAEVEVLTELKDAESKGLELDVGQSVPLRSTKVSYQRISVVAKGEHAIVTATLDFDGKVKDTVVSSLGAERVPFQLGSSWEPTEGLAPKLAGVVKALEKRRAALEKGDVSGLCSGRADAGEGPDLAWLLQVQRRKVRATRWLIRNEREDVLVTEEWRVTGDLPDRPVDDLGTRRLKLQPAAGGEFCFPEGLM